MTAGWRSAGNFSGVHRHRFLIALLAVPLASLALWTPAASAESTYNRLLNVYEQTGSIPACSFSSAQLEGVLKSADTYAAQYFADFTNAISAALAERAGGACSPRRSGAVGVNAGNVRLALPHVPTATGAGVPLPLVLLAIIGAAALVLALVTLAVRLTGWEPGWAHAWRHSWDEAEYKIAGGWVALVDRLRRRRSPRRGA